jgi:hypothetical protein
MQIISLLVVVRLSLGIGLADASETDDREGIAAAPQCIPTTTDRCHQTALFPGIAVPVPEPPPAFAAQAKRFLPAY